MLIKFFKQPFITVSIGDEDTQSGARQPSCPVASGHRTYCPMMPRNVAKYKHKMQRVVA
jgi:hypothetical protein